uniref:Nucleocapsid protein n=1 Tax=Hemipteran orthomyxo-related virus OKIAV183 TaxID=2746270 RepID=A0A7D7JQA8_9ORTO|nr:nucleocapsid protein [Hemipteran orthomyxo-related virus OKIAV183]
MLVDPDTGKTLPDPKRRNIQLDNTIKVNCLKALFQSYRSYHSLFAAGQTNFPINNLNVSHAITSIIFTVHNYHRQMVTQTSSNMIKKTSATDFKITFNGKEISKTKEVIFKIWLDLTKRLGLEYKVFAENDSTNWYGTMGPYLNFFAAWGLRLTEGRTGHGKMPTGKLADGTIKNVSMDRYGLVGAHHILLEGNTFPPERRASMAQSLGPMTAFMCMINSEGKYRNKWENAVKKTMSHIAAVDDIISVTRTTKDSASLAPMLSLLADILLITTTRQTQRVTFPLVMFATVCEVHEGTKTLDDFLEGFNCSGRGAFYTYVEACKYKWSMTGDYTAEKASQVAFHAIFGTYKEDLSILEQITTTGNWYTREELGTCFKKTLGRAIEFELPGLTHYAKMASANQSGLLSGVYTQVSSMPCFSGLRTVTLGDDFFTHLSRRTAQNTGGKTIPQIVSALSNTLQDLHKMLSETKGQLKLGTKKWCSIEGLTLTSDGKEVDTIFQARGKLYMGKKD